MFVTLGHIRVVHMNTICMMIWILNNDCWSAEEQQIMRGRTTCWKFRVHITQCLANVTCCPVGFILKKLLSLQIQNPTACFVAYIFHLLTLVFGEQSVTHNVYVSMGRASPRYPPWIQNYKKVKCLCAIFELWFSTVSNYITWSKYSVFFIDFYILIRLLFLSLCCKFIKFICD